MSCLKWNLFRFGSETWITYLQNQHAPLLTVEDLPLVPEASTSLFAFSVYRNTSCFAFFLCRVCNRRFLMGWFLFFLTADKINNLRAAASAACWITMCFCCNLEVWKQIKARQIWSRQGYFYSSGYCFNRTAKIIGWAAVSFSISQYFIFINML